MKTSPERAGTLRARVTQVLITALIATAALIGLAATAPAASAHHGNTGCNSHSVGRPYYHHNFWGQRFIYGHAQTQCTGGLPISQVTATATLEQYYGGRWNAVATSPRAHQYGNWYLRTKTPAAARCHKPFTAYYFRIRADGLAYWWQSRAWYRTTPHYSQTVVAYC